MDKYQLDEIFGNTNFINDINNFGLPSTLNENDKNLIADIDRINNFFQDLKELSYSEGYPPLNTIQKTEVVWSDIIQKFGFSPVPLLSAGTEDGILISFDKDNKSLGIEVFNDRLEVYYEDFINDYRILQNYYLIEDVLEIDYLRLFFD